MAQTKQVCRAGRSSLFLLSVSWKGARERSEAPGSAAKQNCGQNFEIIIAATVEKLLRLRTVQLH
eukprot:21511-Heterococcus_DN1.PRE.2